MIYHKVFYLFIILIIINFSISIQIKKGLFSDAWRYFRNKPFFSPPITNNANSNNHAIDIAIAPMHLSNDIREIPLRYIMEGILPNGIDERLALLARQNIDTFGDEYMLWQDDITYEQERNVKLVYVEALVNSKLVKYNDFQIHSIINSDSIELKMIRKISKRPKHIPCESCDLLICLINSISDKDYVVASGSDCNTLIFIQSPLYLALLSIFRPTGYHDGSAEHKTGAIRLVSPLRLTQIDKPKLIAGFLPVGITENMVMHSKNPSSQSQLAPISVFEIDSARYLYAEALLTLNGQFLSDKLLAELTGLSKLSIVRFRHEYSVAKYQYSSQLESCLLIDSIISCLQTGNIYRVCNTFNFKSSHIYYALQSVFEIKDNDQIVHFTKLHTIRDIILTNIEDLTEDNVYSFLRNVPELSDISTSFGKEVFEEYGSKHLYNYLYAERNLKKFIPKTSAVQAVTISEDSDQYLIASASLV